MGASGGMFGLLGAALVISYRRDAGSLDRERRLRTWLGVALLIGLGISFLPEISMAGHVGGLIGGVLVASTVEAQKNA